MSIIFFLCAFFIVPIFVPVILSFICEEMRNLK